MHLGLDLDSYLLIASTSTQDVLVQVCKQNMLGREIFTASPKIILSMIMMCNQSTLYIILYIPPEMFLHGYPPGLDHDGIRVRPFLRMYFLICTTKPHDTPQL